MMMVHLSCFEGSGILSSGTGACCVFLWSAFTCHGHAHQALKSLWWNLCVDRLDLSVYDDLEEQG